MKHLLIVSFFLCSISVYAQDVIVKKDGSTILSKVLEINTAEIKYKKFSNQNGPTYTISKTEIMSINYENGEKDIFKENVNNGNTNGSDNKTFMVESVPTSQNVSLIACHNQDNHYAKKNSKRKAAWRLIFAHVSNNSTLQNSDIEIAFAPSPEWGLFKIKLVNLTNNMLYIDLGNCFRVHQDGSFGTYYENIVTSTSETKGGSTGAGLNLGSVAGVLGFGGAIGTLAGGVNVGGSKDHSSTTTTVTYQERYITIPPKGSYILGGGEQFLTYDTGKDLCVGEEISYTELDSPDKTDYIFTYSSDRSFSKYGTIKATIYIAKQIGSKFVYSGEANKYITGLDKNTLWDCHYAK